MLECGGDHLEQLPRQQVVRIWVSKLLLQKNPALQWDEKAHAPEAGPGNLVSGLSHFVILLAFVPNDLMVSNGTTLNFAKIGKTS